MDSEESAKRVEFKLPLLMLRTKKFISAYERLGALRVTGAAAWIGLYVVPIIAAVGIFFIGLSLLATVSQPAARELGRQIGPRGNLLLPVLNPFLPILPVLLGVFVGLLVHEGAHGVISRRLSYGVKSSGLLFFLIVPIGAFVELNEDELKIAKGKDSGRILAGGPMANILVALVSLLLLISVASSMTPRLDGVFVSDVQEGFPAQLSGVNPGDILLRIDGTPVTSVEELRVQISKKSVGDTVTLDLNRGFTSERYSVSISLARADDPADPLPKIGVILVSRIMAGILEAYRQNAFQPFSPFYHLYPPSFPGGELRYPYSDQLIPFYESPLGLFFRPVVNILYWTWFVNINLAIFNSLPIYPLDGGKIFRIGMGRLLRKRGGDTVASYVTYATTGVVLGSLFLFIMLPFILT